MVSQEDQVNLVELIAKARYWWRFILSKWLILLVAGILGGGIGFWYASTIKPIYTATLSFALEEDKSSAGGLGGALGLASQLGFDLGTSAGGAFSGANLVELMKSRKLVEQTLLGSITEGGKKTTLVENYIDINELRKGWEKDPQLQSIRFPPDADRSKFSLKQDSILGLIYDDINRNQLMVAQKDKKISIITVEMKGIDQAFCKTFVEMLANEVSDFYINTKSKKAKTNVAILERQVDSIRTELNNAITGVAIFTDNTYNLNPALNIKRTPSTRRQIDVQANSAILTQLVTNLEVARVTLRKETPLIQVIDTPILPLKKEKLSRLKALILGGFLAGFIVLGIVLLRKFSKEYLQPLPKA